LNIRIENNNNKELVCFIVELIINHINNSNIICKNIFKIEGMKKKKILLVLVIVVEKFVEWLILNQSI
jgi:hypothetical protein